MSTGAKKPYHHGYLKRAGIDGAVAEAEAVGVAAASMRRIARRVGVSHTALTYAFGDKAGILTAVATEGFHLAASTIAAAALESDGFVRGGLAYIEFAFAHRGYFDVMFRPDLHRTDDADLASARTAVFAVLYDSAHASLRALHAEAVTEDDIRGLVLAGWSASHGFASLALTANLPNHFFSNRATLAAQIDRGIVTMGELVERAASTLADVKRDKT